MSEDAGSVTVGGLRFEVFQTYADIGPSKTDGILLPAVVGKRIIIISLAMLTGAVATNCRFKSKPSGSGTNISTLFQNAAYGGAVLPRNVDGWMRTNAGEAFAVDTNAGSPITGFQFCYYLR